MITIPLWSRRCRTLWFAALIEKVLRTKLPYSTGKLTILKLFRDSFDAHVNRCLKPEFGKGGKGYHGRHRAQIRDCPPNYNSLPFSKRICFWNLNSDQHIFRGRLEREKQVWYCEVMFRIEECPKRQMPFLPKPLRNLCWWYIWHLRGGKTN